ncbi:hypothetical protein OAQ_21470, partial [Vibrio cyclitrophicus ZF30]
GLKKIGCPFYRVKIIRNAWHFYYALCSVFKVVCGGIGIALLHLNRALVFTSSVNVKNVKSPIISMVNGAIS